MNFKNAYEYLLNYQPIQQLPQASKIQDSQVEINQKPLQNQKLQPKKEKENLGNTICDSRSVTQINLGENPFDLLGSNYYKQQLQFSKQAIKSKHKLQEISESQESNQQDYIDQYEISIQVNETMKEEIVQFLSLFGDVKVSKQERPQIFQNNQFIPTIKSVHKNK